MKSLAIGLIATTFLATAVRAQVTVDVSKITCEQYVFSKIASPRSLANWLSGYYSGKQNKTVVDMQAFETAADAVEKACRLPQNLKLPLMQVAEKVITQGR